ncbi:MAG: rod shape-determining protein MreD [Candidatus Omnitrophica bacterium]|nr:rod shape-determining protein MreD [Candidatus Omnitrophota bacterium]
MGKAAVITFFVVVAFVIESLLFHLAGRWATPDLELLLVLFFNMYFGIRYGLVTAVLAGTIRDSFSTGTLGVNVCSFIVAAYMTTILKQYIYHMGSRLSRYILILLIITTNAVVHYYLYRALVGALSPGQVFRFVFLPEAVVTLLVAPFVFEGLKKCVSRLFA